MTNEDLIRLGFKQIPHFTIGHNVVFSIGRNKYFSAGGVGTPNEMVFLCETNHTDPTEITDLICLHNWDRDGPLTEERICMLINIISNKEYFKL